MKKELQLQLQGVDVQFGSHLALRQIDLNVYAGERVAFVGVNGSGKSTLLRVIHGVLPVSSGQVHWQAGVQQAMVFQRPYMLRTTVINFVALALWLQGAQWRIAKEQALAALHQVDLQDLAHRNLAFARALAVHPQCMLLDEPTSSLDPHAKREVERIMHDWIADNATTLLFSSHNLGQVKRLATRVVYLENGRILADLPTEQFFHQPLERSHPEAHLFLRGERV
ncbi:MAG: ATP-binding cassette domain-containing protein [Betaproteobacteria bacterium]|nr:ATP-binding cassette domain-containing protein [Betaproteobacteria bacterium]